MKSVVALVTSLGLFGLINQAHAADLHVIFPSALAPAMNVLVPQFEQAAGQKVIVTHGGIGEIAKHVRGGDDIDVVISADSQITDMIKDKKVTEGTQSHVAAGGIGIAVRAGAAPIDISTAEKFKSFMSTVQSLTYVDPATGSAVGAYVVQLFEKEGLSVALKPRTILAPSAAGLFEAVTSGKAEIGLAQKSEIVDASGVQIAGVLPAGLQNVTKFDAAVASQSKQPEAGKALIAFLTNPASTGVFQSKGLGL